ncbi:branched-chain amino acid ABC transporter permease [Paenibacillus sp. JMULE4]|uniref:branched-chain amino acid ABC transporter permease n=1 Tax=Paenibacillus TaxID=44249 RepID=UPI0015768741|nr:branched-chain amino acid ABC transporter permease [Paenibacillus sp. JMULE4]NTZ17422.1 branched-chain amino acid ABC transporter permease [Paenibacillus sp. JMULE4]
MDAQMMLFQQSFWSGITIGFIYALIALGFTIIFNVSKILNIAQGEFTMIGALSLYSFVTTLNSPYWVGLLLTVVLASVIGWFMVKMAINPLKKPDILTMIVVTVAFGEILKGAAFLVWGSDNFAIPALFKSVSIPVFSANVDSQTILIIAVSLLIYFGFRWVNQNTYFGRALTAISGDPYAAGLMGIHVKRMILVVFIIGSIMGSVAGILAGPLITMSYYQGSMLGIKAFIAALLGGLGSYGGAIIGGLILGLFEAYAAGFVSSLLKDAFSFIVLLVLLVFLPSGLVSVKSLYKKNG